MLNNEHINSIIQTIHAKGNDGLGRQAFLPLAVQDELIHYLLKYDLIETEDDPNHFYLTDRGYDILEEGRWYDVELESEEGLPDNFYGHEGLFYSQVESDEDLKERHSKKKMIRPNYFVQGWIVAILAGSGIYLMNHKNPNFGPKHQEIKEEMDVFSVEKQGDTIFLSKKLNER
jgi:predicted transcriptional regulator